MLLCLISHFLFQYPMYKFRFTFLLIFVLSLTQQANALISITVTGNTNTVPSLASSYVSFSSAVSALNSVTTINGPVTFNMTSGTTETSTAQITLTQAGSLLYPIVFQKTGSLANPKLTRTDAGTNTTAALGAFGDGVLRIDGTDNITFNGLDLAASNQGIEYGYYLNKPSATNGCQSLTIKNAVVTMTKGTSAYVTGIYIGNGQTALTASDGQVVSAASGRHYNIILTGNTIQNVSYGIVHYGCYISTRSLRDKNIFIGQPGTGNGNTIQNFGGGTASTSYGVYDKYGDTLRIENNVINNIGGGGVAHTTSLYGIYTYDVSGVCTYSNNQITLNNTANDANWIYNYFFGYSLHDTILINNNTFAGTVGSATTSYLIYNGYNGSNTTKITRNNSTSGTITNAGTGGTLYAYYNDGSSNQTETIVNNNFSNINSGGSFYGIYTSSNTSSQCVIDSNQINNIISSATNSTVSGIEAREIGNCEIKGNTVSNLSGNSVRGIMGSASSYVAHYSILQNRIYGLNSIATSTTNFVVYGCRVYFSGYAGSAAIYNNLIGNLTAPSSSSTDAIRGIFVDCFILPDSVKIDVAHNTVYINASSSTATNFGTTGIYHNTSTTFAERLLFRNNIIVNTSTPKGTGLTAAFRRYSVNSSSFDPASNHNLYYAGTPSPTQVIFTNGTNTFSQLSDYQNYMLGAMPAADRNSITENIAFLSLNGSSADFLKFDTLIASGAESGGQSLVLVPNDINGVVRANQNGYTGSGSSPDIGAWELNGTALSQCAGTPSPAMAFASSANPCSDSLFAVYTTPIYGSGFTYQWQKSMIDSVNGYSNVANAQDSYLSTTTNTDAWYRCLITCSSSNQTVTSSAVFVNTTPLSGSYLISNTGSGQYLNFAAAIADLNCRGAEAPVTFLVADGQVFNEGVDLSIRYTGNYPILFKKQGNGVNPVIMRSGTSSTSNFVLELNGADHITFDGIDFGQSGTASASWVEYGIHITNRSATNGSQYNTFKNGTITLTTASSNTIGVYLHTSSQAATVASGTNSHNRFVNMTVQQSFLGYKFDNTSTIVRDDSNEVVGENGLRGNINSIGNTSGANNVYGIYASEEQHFRVDSVDIYGIQAAYCVVLYFASSNNLPTTFSNNHIHFNSSTSSILAMGVYSNGGGRFFNNEINEIASSNASSSGVIGMNFNCGDSTFIYNNKIYNLSITGTSTQVYGIRLSGPANYRLYNNMISDLRAGTSTYYPAAVSGIEAEYGSNGQIQLYNNSIYLTDVGANSSYRSSCIVSYDSTFQFDMRNNLMLNLSNVTNGSLAMGFMKAHAVDNVTTTCNNNLWYSGVPDAKHLIYYCTSPTFSGQTLLQYKTAVGIGPAESESVSGPVSIIPTLDGTIRPDNNVATLVEGRAQVLATVSTDFEGDTRSALTPDIGADEGTFTAMSSADCAPLTSPANALSGICPFETVQLNWTAPTSGRTPTGGYDIYLGTTSNPPFVANTSSLNYTVQSLQAGTTYYWKVIAKFLNGAASGCETRTFSTSNTAITSLSGAQRCGSGIVTLNANGGGTIQWFSSASGGTPLFTGSSYSPSLSATTTYYVSSVNGYSVSSSLAGKPSIGGSSTSGTSASEYESFNALTSIIIDSVVVYPSAAGTVVLNLANSSGTILLTASKVVTAGQVGLPVTMAVNWPVTDGVGYRIYKPATSVNLLRNTSGAVYPYTTASLVSVTGSSGGATYYSWAYNWTIRMACQSPRQPVTATITNTISTRTTVYACNSYTWSTAGLTYTNSGIYTHTSQASGSCIQTDSLILTIGVSGNNPPVNVTTCSAYNWPVNNQTYTTSGTYIATFTNINGCDSSWQLNLTIQSCSTPLSLKLFIQGYYAGNGKMNPVLMNQGIGSDTSITDFITIELHNASNLLLAGASSAILHTNGNVSANIAVGQGLYYIVIKYRNSVESWSASPIAMNGSPIYYDFTNNAGKLYGSNQFEVEPGIWALYTGDLNADENVDLFDIASLEIDINDFAFGYFATDLNGDGNVDLLDTLLLEENTLNFIYAQHP